MNHVFGELGILSAGKSFLPEDYMDELGKIFVGGRYSVRYHDIWEV